MTATIPTTRRLGLLVSARIVAGVLGTVQLAGAMFFLLIARGEAVWVGPWLDVPVVVLTITLIVLKLVVAFTPGMLVPRRITIGLTAVCLGVVVTLVKITMYDEPEGAVFLAADVLLGALLLLAWRHSRHV